MEKTVFKACRVISLIFYPFDHLSFYCYGNNVMSTCHHHNKHYPLYNHHHCRTYFYSNSLLTLNNFSQSFYLLSLETHLGSESTKCLPCELISLGCGMKWAESYFLVTCFVVLCMMLCTVRVLTALDQYCVMNADHNSNTNCFLRSNYLNLCSFYFWHYLV